MLNQSKFCRAFARGEGRPDHRTFSMKIETINMPLVRNKLLRLTPVSASANDSRIGVRTGFYNPHDGETLPAILAQGLWLAAFFLHTIVFPTGRPETQTRKNLYPPEMKPAPLTGRRRLTLSH